jgi:hypothetical protein
MNSESLLKFGTIHLQCDELHSDEGLKGKAEGSTRLTYTGLRLIEDLPEVFMTGPMSEVH